VMNIHLGHGWVLKVSSRHAPMKCAARFGFLERIVCVPLT
jgi:hypothetical protein